MSRNFPCFRFPNHDGTRVADAVIGVTFFGDLNPEFFGTFCRAFIAMFRMTMGSVEFWFEIFPAVNADDGSISFGPSTFFITYVVMANSMCRFGAPSAP